MVRVSPGRRLVRRTAGAALSLFLLAAIAFQASPVAAGSSCSTPPPVFPEGSLHRGLTATGWTVIQGKTPTYFDVKILGVQPGGIAPGLDFILAQITGPAGFLDQTGGIVAGMSGSPVYIGGDLVGSTSYGFSAADQTMMGITPAQPMVNLFSYPSSSAPSMAVRSMPRMATRVPLSRTLRTRAANATGLSATDFSTARQLRMPLAVSGLNGRAMSRFNKRLRHYGLPVVAYRAAAAKVGTASSTPLQPGQSLGSALSYGDFSVAAVGTATATCGDEVVGYGHPLTFAGKTDFGMNAAKVLAVIKDPSTLGGGFKVANLTSVHGVVDQDRLAGIRGIEGPGPSLINMRTEIQNLDLGTTARKGHIQIVRGLDLGPFFIGIPDIAAFGLLSEADVAFDRLGAGSVALHWVITGTDPGGAPFRLGRSERFYSPYDATISSIFEMYDELSSLQNSQFGKPSLYRIKVDGSVTQQQVTTRIGRVLSSSSMEPGFRARRRLLVRPGDTVHLRVSMLDQPTSTHRTVNLSVWIPRRLEGGQLQIRHGRGSGGFFFFGNDRARRASSFTDLVHQLAHAEHNYDLIAELTGGRGGSVGPSPKPSPTPAMSTGTRVDRKLVTPQDQVVLGGKSIRIVVVR